MGAALGVQVELKLSGARRETIHRQARGGERVTGRMAFALRERMFGEYAGAYSSHSALRHSGKQ